jgi:glycosyltransferase involved in cell wall biosynthesis
MRVLHVVQSLKGGTGSYLNEILPDQAKRWGHSSVALVVPQADVGFLAPELHDWRSFYFADARRGPLSLAGFARAIRSAYREFQPDIVHLHSTFAGAVGRMLLAGKRRRPRVIYCAHGWAFDRTETASAAAIAAVERQLGRLTDVILNISEAEGRSARRHRVVAQRNVVIPNAIADVPWQGKNERAAAAARVGYDASKINLLFVGRHDRQKGADIAEAAAALLPGSEFHLYNIGDSALGRGESLGDAAPNVTRLGWLPRDDVFLHMRAADALLMPSRWEGFGLTAIEAMRAGAAVFASAAGALPEIVVDGVTGRIIPDNTAGAFAAAIRASNLATLGAMGAAGRQRFELQYRLDRLLSDLDGLYRSLAGDRIAAEIETVPAG